MNVCNALSLILDLASECTPEQIRAIEQHTGSEPGDVAHAIEVLDVHLTKLNEPRAFILQF